MTGFALSPDGHLAIATAFQSKTVVLYLRDPGSGLMGRLDIARRRGRSAFRLPS